MRTIYHLIRQALLAFLFATVALSPALTQGFSSQTEQRLQQVLEDFQNDPSLPIVGGISAAIKVDGLASWEGATGYAARNVDGQNNLLAGGTAFSTSHLSRGYSITKTFTAALVLELAKEGVFELDDAISQYMPYMSAYNPTLNSAVTIRQLLYHESGYSDWEENLQLQIAIAFDPNHAWTPYELMVFTAQLSAPGTVRRYSHNNYVFLGAIIEAATGRDVEDLYRERFFTPLGLESIYLEGREAHGNRPPLAAPHDNISPFNPIFQFTGQPTFPNTYTNISAFPFTAITSLGFTGGGLVSNAADLAEWSNALFGGRITSPGILESMLNSISATPDEFGNLLGYGIKNTSNISGEYDFIGHNGSAPGYRSVMFYNPERKMSIVVLTNFAGVSAYEIARALFEALPEFTCGSDIKKEKKMIVCKDAQNLCVDRVAAQHLISQGAYLGTCESNSVNRTSVPLAEKTIVPQTGLTIYPNPATSKVSVAFTVPGNSAVNIRLFDISGKLIQQLYNAGAGAARTQVIEVQTGKLQAGVYIVRMQTPTGNHDQKLVINH